jgi:hypothetical protein
MEWLLERLINEMFEAKSQYQFEMISEIPA